jgi:hypothetical protein
MTSFNVVDFELSDCTDIVFFFFFYKGCNMLTHNINYQLHPFVSFYVLSHSKRVHKCEQHISLGCAPREFYLKASIH